jgi:hypothetical protein
MYQVGVKINASMFFFPFAHDNKQVALVQLKVPLEIVPNTISKRKTGKIQVAIKSPAFVLGNPRVHLFI